MRKRATKGDAMINIRFPANRRIRVRLGELPEIAPAYGPELSIIIDFEFKRKTGPKGEPLTIAERCPRLVPSLRMIIHAVGHRRRSR